MTFRTNAPAETAGLAAPARDAAGSSARNGTSDLLRFGAALIIVVFHARLPGGQFMMSAMGIFTILLTYHACRQSGRAGFAAALRPRAARLLRPFAVWGAVYAALLLADAWRAGEPLGAALAGWLPPQGTMHHLWFLPFAFVAATLASLVPAREGVAGWAPAFAAPVVAAALVIAWADLPMPVPLRVWGNYLPSALLGVALAALPARAAPRLLLAVLGAALGLMLFAQGWPTTQQLAVSLPLVTAGLILPLPSTPALRRLADLSMAIYLVHPLILGLALRLTGEPIGALQPGLVTLAGSVAAAAVLCTVPRLRRIAV